MNDQDNSRRNFLKLLGITASASLLSKNVLAGFVDRDKIKKLNPNQQVFMVRYGQWMDEFTEVVRKRKIDPDNIDALKRMMELSEESEKLKPELQEFLKDEDFALIFQASIDRVTREIASVAAQK